VHNYLALAAGVVAAVRGLAIAGQACMAHDGCNAKLQELTNKAKELVGLGNDDKAANKPARDTSVTQKEADDMRKQGLDPINKGDIKNFQGDKDQSRDEEKGNSKDASNKGKEAQTKGQKGDSDAREKYPEIGEKITKPIPINDRKRLPDGDTKAQVSEIKDVKKQGWTKQLQDYADYAKEKTKDFVLYLREGNKTSKPLENAEQEGKVKIKRY